MQYDFEWDPVKAEANRRKHGVRFEDAASVFRDPRMLSIYDDEHSGQEDRWLTMGLSARGGLLVVHHTFSVLDDETAVVRIISGRKASRNEQSQYAEHAT